MSIINVKAIYVLWMREVKKFVRVKSRIIGTIAMPLLFLVFLGFGFNNMTLPGIPKDINYIKFLVPGIIGMSLLFSSIFSGITVISDRQFGFLKEIMVAPVSRVSIALGRIAGGATIALLQGVMILLITLLMGFEIISLWAFLLSIIFMVLISASFISVGLMFASRMKDVHGFQLVVNFFVFPIFFLSGAIYPLDNLPSVIRYLSMIDPLTYGVDGMRAAFTGFSVLPIGIDLIIIAAFAFVMVLLSSYLFEKSKVL
ncbi:ABC transporter permease [Candidatus Woesearchaeota archaeon]|nr:ABC transporter permease [Candidatus Woesearchaeota archaeon]